MKTSPRPPLVSGNGIALHRQLFLCLRDQIVRGNYAPGDQLPNEDDLIEMFGISRITVRRALSDLEAEGLLTRKQRLGTFVRADFRPDRRAASLAFLDALQESALEMEPAELRHAANEAAPPDIAHRLRLAPGQTAMHTRRRRMLEDIPLVVSEAWVPAHLLQGISDTAIRKNLLYRLLLAQRIEFGRVIQEVASEAADPGLAQALEIGIGSPVLRITRLLHNTEGLPVQYLTAWYGADRTRIVTDAGIDTIGTGKISHIVARTDN